MEQIQQQINLYHLLHGVCLGFCLCFLILSIVLFFKFDIIHILNTRSRHSSPIQTTPLINDTRELEEREIDESYGMFKIEKYEMLIHTNESI